MYSDEIKNYLIKPDLLDNISLIEIKQVLEEFPYFQIGWFLYSKNLKNVNSLEYENNLKRIAVQVPERHMLYRFIKFDKQRLGVPASELKKENEEILSTTNTEKNPDNNDLLIDKFLYSKHTKIRRKIDEEEMESDGLNKVIEKSVSEDDELITETLATLYFQQKKYDKALDAFKKLSLKYPEKSVYFATRIEEIEKLKNLN